MDKFYSKEEIYETLISDIIYLRYKPGDMLKETELSARFNVSRTPLREVIKELALEGYISVLPRHGNKVSLIDADNVAQIVEMREVIETAVEKQLIYTLTEEQRKTLQDILDSQAVAIETNDTGAFWELDNKFHQTMFCFAEKPVWWDTIKRYEAHYMRFRKLEMTDNTNYELLYVHHKNILKNIVDKNIAAVEPAVVAHVGHCLDRLPVLIDKYPSYFKA